MPQGYMSPRPSPQSPRPDIMSQSMQTIPVLVRPDQLSQSMQLVPTAPLDFLSQSMPAKPLQSALASGYSSPRPGNGYVSPMPGGLPDFDGAWLKGSDRHLIGG